MLRVSLLLLVVLALLCPTEARAQIVNTLRGFPEDEPGWSGNLDGYFDIAEGNTNYREYGGSVTFQYLAKRHRVRGLGSALRKQSQGEDIAEASRVHLRHNYWFQERWASILFVQDSRNPFQRLDSRFLAGFGARFDAVRKESLSCYLGIVTMLENEEIQGDSRGRETEHRMSTFLSVMYDVSQDTQLDLVAFYQPEWSDFGDYRTVISARLKVEIIGALYLSLSYGFQRDSRPPEGVGETDWSFYSGIGWSF